MIADQKVASLHYTVKDTEGNVVDSSQGGEPLVYLHGQNNIITGLESALADKSTGDTFDVTVEPADAYGEYNEELLQVVPRKAFEGVEKIELGMVFSAEAQNGPVRLKV
ncbi:MAG: FKBP-type peptidyl-prolyl cis-trans isomerase SlyD, partial [Paraglaciecola sp.]